MSPDHHARAPWPRGDAAGRGRPDLPDGRSEGGPGAALGPSWAIRPREGLGPLTLGAGRATVRALLGPGHEVLDRTWYTRGEADRYRHLGLHLAYDAADRLDAIEAVPPGRPAFDGAQVFSAGPRAVLDRLAALGQRAPLIRGGYRFHALGLVLHVAGATIAGVGLYRPGRHDRGAASWRIC